MPVINGWAEWASLGLQVLIYIISLTTVWSRMGARLNGLGTRVKKVEESCAEQTGRHNEMSRELGALRAEANAVHQQIGELNASILAVNEHITEMKVEIVGKLSEINNLILSKDGDVRERIARIETKRGGRDD